jgi:hypothetical protein
LFTLTWKAQALRSGLLICRLRASGRRTSDSGSSSWATPTANEKVRSDEFGEGRSPNAREALASWPTPVKQDAASSARTTTIAQKWATDHKQATAHTMLDAARMASWPTPMAGSPAKPGPDGYNAAGNTDYSRRVVELASWATPATPATRDWHSASGSPEFLAERAEMTRGKPLSEQAFTLAPWATPVVRDHRNSGGDGTNERDLPRQASGAVPTGSPAEMEKPGQLNPAHSRWLMGLPPEWDACAPTATRSSRRSPRNSLKQP